MFPGPGLSPGRIVLSKITQLKLCVCVYQADEGGTFAVESVPGRSAEHTCPGRGSAPGLWSFIG